ncbi:MAG: hypothetical protein M1819_003676 [Sarea resinae]|nr:MAG: hypothetical protein M1819_003676 [Sarea resinae]
MNSPSTPASEMIHIIGVGNIGKFIAHSLAGIPKPPPVTLVFRRHSSVRVWEQYGRKIDLMTHGQVETHDGFHIDLVGPLDTEAEATDPGQFKKDPSETAATASGTSALEDEDGDVDAKGIIHNLIVTVPAQNTISALSKVRHRLTRDSTILLLQNGMGVIDQVNKELFPDIETRPNYMLGVITHGIYPIGNTGFGINLGGLGTIALGILPRYPIGDLSSLPPGAKASEKWASSSRYLLQTIIRTPVLAATGFSPTDLQLMQLEKLAVNSIINPLTAVLACRNGDLLNNFALTRTMRLLLAETSLVIRSLPELQGVPNIQTRFAPHRLETITVSVAAKTSKNLSSMLQNIRAAKETEIDYINGYIVRRGEELGISCVMNYMLIQMLKGKAVNLSNGRTDGLPVEAISDSFGLDPSL